MKTVNIGLFGFGVVGTSFYKAVQEFPNYTITKIAVKNKEKKRPVEIAPKVLAQHADEIIFDNEIGLIVELINDADYAWEIVNKAFIQRKSVISANKKMIAEHLPELIALQQRYGVKFFYEAAVCGSIPIIRILQQHFHFDQIKSLSAIANGTCNYILTKMQQENLAYDQALEEAQKLGFAETDASSDINGDDANYKLSLLIYHAFQSVIPVQNIVKQGIANVNEVLIKYCKENHLKIKLLARAARNANGIGASVTLYFLPNDHPLAAIDYEENGVLVDAELTGMQLFRGKGAGGDPTAASVLANLFDVTNVSQQNTEGLPVELKEVNNSDCHYYYVSGDNLKYDKAKLIYKGDSFSIVYCDLFWIAQQYQFADNFLWVSYEYVNVDKLLSIENII